MTLQPSTGPASFDLGSRGTTFTPTSGVSRDLPSIYLPYEMIDDADEGKDQQVNDYYAAVREASEREHAKRKRDHKHKWKFHASVKKDEPGWEWCKCGEWREAGEENHVHQWTTATRGDAWFKKCLTCPAEMALLSSKEEHKHRFIMHLNGDQGNWEECECGEWHDLE